MTKLKKLFPLSFKFANSGKRLFLGILFYLLIELGVRVVLSYTVSPILSSAVLLPLILVAGCIAIPLLVIGVLLFFLFPPLGMIVMLIGTIPIYAVLIVYSVLLSVIGGLVTAYTLAGITISFLAYGGVFGNIN